MGADNSVIAKPKLPELPQTVLHEIEEAAQTVYGEDSFMSCESDLTNQNRNASLHQPSSHELEFCSLVNFANLQASFLTASVSDFVESNPFPKTLYDSLISYRESSNYQGCVAACATFILSYLKTFGKHILTDTSLLNEKTETMFSVLEELYFVLDNMKKHQWQNRTSTGKDPHLRQKCSECNARELLLKQIKLLNLTTDTKLCLVCLTILDSDDSSIHRVSDSHLKIKKQLIDEIYPKNCKICSMRFTSDFELDLHIRRHDNTKMKENLFSMSYHCCYLCRTAFQNVTGLHNHQKLSLEHACRKELAVELALRLEQLSLLKMEESPYLEEDKDANLQNHSCSLLDTHQSSKVSLHHETSSVKNLTFTSSCSKGGVSGDLNSPCSNNLYVYNDSLADNEAIDIPESYYYNVKNSQDEKSLIDGIFCEDLKHDELVEEMSLVHSGLNTENTVVTHAVDLRGKDGFVRSESPEFEAECKDCGGVFIIYNNDMKLSMDRHCQSAQHNLAITKFMSNEGKIPSAPLQFPPASMSTLQLRGGESFAGNKVLKPPIETKAIEDVSNSPTKSCGSYQEDIVWQFVTEEKKCLRAKKHVLFCDVCSVEVPSGEMAVLTHVWGERHLRLAFAQDSAEGLSQAWQNKLQPLFYWEQYSLKTGVIDPSKGGVYSIKNVINCVKNLRKFILQNFPSATYVYICDVCLVPVHSKNRVCHEAGKQHQGYMAKVENISTLVQSNSNVQVLPQKEKTTCQKGTWKSIFCNVCMVYVPSGNRASHEAGKQHKVNMAKVGKTGTLAQSDTNMQALPGKEKKIDDTKPAMKYFYCKLCDRQMQYASKKAHLNGASHRKMASTSGVAIP